MHVQLPWQSIGTAGSGDKSGFAAGLTRQMNKEREHHHSAPLGPWGREVAQGHQENTLERPQESQPSPISSGTKAKLEGSKTPQPLTIFPVKSAIEWPHTNSRGHKGFLAGFSLLNLF